MPVRESTYAVPVPPERVVAVLLSEPFQLALARARPDVADARLEDHGGGRFDVHTDDYGRTRTGAIDRSRRWWSVTRNAWDPDTGVLRWRWEGKDARVQLSGEVRVSPEGAGCRVVNRREIQVSIPVVGRLIARYIDREFQASGGRWRELMEAELGL